MPLYIARHGQSLANKQKVFAGGDLDSPLTAKGRAQAGRLGLRLRRVKIDIIICSPLLRAQRTAKIVKSLTKIKEPIVTEPGITEFEVGSLSGQPVGPTGDAFWGARGVEDPEEFKKRVVNAIKKWHNKYPSKNILFVAHTGVVRVIICAEKGLPGKKFREQDSPSNGSFRRIEIDKL